MSDEPESVPEQLLKDQAANLSTEGAAGVSLPDRGLTFEGVSELPPGVQPSRNYMAAVQLGHVLAKSKFFPEARDASRAAVMIMLGMDLGLSPTAALLGIHYFEEKGKPVFLIESKLLAALIKLRPGYDYKVIERTDVKCTLRFERNKKPLEPDVTYTVEDAAKSGLIDNPKKPAWQTDRRVMLTWRCMSEGQRLHFPEITVGQPIYTMEEFGVDEDDLKLRDALEPAKPPPLSDAKAEELRTRARKIKDEIDEINPDAVNPVRFANAIAKAEHSHEQLENVVNGYEFLRDCDREFIDVAAELELKMDRDEFKSLVERAKRRGQPQERVDVLKAALNESGASDERE